jgi:hypothetical protein
LESPTSRVIAEIGKTSPLICTDDTDRKSSKSEILPRMNADQGKIRKVKSKNPLTTHSTTLRAGCGHEGTQRNAEVKGAEGLNAEVFNAQTHAKLG